MSEPSQMDERCRPCIVMLVANPFVHDTRVYKQARSLIEWGADVHVLALRRKDLPDEEIVDGIRVHRLAVPEPRWRVLVKLPVSLLLPRRWLLRLLLRPNDFESSGAGTEEVIGFGVSPALHASGAVLPSAALTQVNSADCPEDRRPLKEPSAVPALGRRVLSRIRRALRRVVRAVRGRLIVPVRNRVRSRVRRCRQAARRARLRMTPNATRLVELNALMLRRALALRPDVIECHDLNTLLAGFYARKLRGVSLVYDSHELYLERNIGQSNRRKDRLLWGFIERCCIGECNAVLSVAQSICIHLERQYGVPRPHLIRNVQPFEPPCERSRLLTRELGIDPELRLVIYPGAITINRGMEVLIDSAAYLDRAAVVIMGYARNDEYLESLRRRARDRGLLGTRVFFRDAVPINDVIRYVRSADVGVVPTQNVCLSYYYESSNKIFHCLMAGVPVAMSDHPEKRLVVEEYGVGVLFDETNPEAIAACINDLLADRVRFDRMEAACLAAAQTLNWEHEEHRLRLVFAELLGAAAPPVPPVRISGAAERVLPQAG